MKGRATGRRFEGARTHYRRHHRVSRKRSCALLAVAATAAAAPLASRAANDNWQVAVGSGNWSTPGNWTFGIPTNGADVFITHNDATNRAVAYDYTGANTFHSLTLDNTGIGTNTLSQAANTLAVTGIEYIGFNGRGVFIQSGGTHTVGSTLNIAFNAGSTGVVNLSGGSLTATSVSLGGAGFGTLNVTGGTLAVANGITVQSGSSASAVTLNGGTVTTAFFTAPGWGRLTFNSGTLNLTGGTSSNTGDLNVGNNLGGVATVNQFAGSSVNAGALYLGTVNGATGIYNLSNGASLNVGGYEEIGYYLGAAGTFNQTGGSNHADNITIADTFHSSNGTYNLSDTGFLSVNLYEFVGRYGTGTFNQSGGTNTGFFLELAYQAGSNGTYNLSNSASLIFTQEDIGYAGPGVFNQTGGTNTTPTLTLGVNAGSTGIYNISGGLLVATNVTLSGSVFGALNATGGAVTVSKALTVQGGASTSVVSINGGTVTAGSFIAPDWGRLSFNAGTLNLTGTSSNAGSLGVGGVTFGGTVVATLNQAGTSIVSIGGDLSLMNSGSTTTFYNLSNSASLTVGNNLNVGAGFLNAIAVFNQTGGSNHIGKGLFLGASGGGNATYNLSNSAYLSATIGEYIGYVGPGTFNQTGGTNNVNNFLYIGYNAGWNGTYNLSNGSLSTFFEYLGVYGNGVFNQTGGTQTGSVLILGNLAGSTGTFNLSNSGSVAFSQEFVGLDGLGVLNQTGGTHTVTTTLFVANHPGSSGTVNLSGGSLTAGSTLNNGTFNHTGGTANLGALSGTGSAFVGNASGAVAVMTVASFAQNAITVRNTGTLRVATNAARFTNTSPALTLTGNGTLDLGNHELLTSTAPATIRTYLSNAYDPAGNADWGKPGLTSSLAKGNPIKFSVAYAFGGDVSAQDAAVTTHGGAPLGATQTIVRPVLTGDANLDGTVNFFDISQVLGYRYNTGGTTAKYTDGDLDYNGKVDFFDLSLLLSANYNTGQTFGPAPSAAAAAAPSLSGSHQTASTASAVAASTTIGGSGDGKPDFEYDPLTGDLRFRTDGGTFTTTGGSASFVSSLTISSASGMLLAGGASSTFAGGTGATLTSTLLSSALTNSPGFGDGFDIGIVLAPGLDPAILIADLTVKYQSLNGGQLKTADVTFVPEPAGMTLILLGAAQQLARIRKKDKNQKKG